MGQLFQTFQFPGSVIDNIDMKEIRRIPKRQIPDDDFQKIGFSAACGSGDQNMFPGKIQ